MPNQRVRSRGRHASCRFLIAAAAAALAMPATAAIVGPGLVSTTGADTADRLNIDDTSGQAFSAGDYDVNGFRFNATGDGNVVPFLATLSGTNEYQLLWIGSAVNGTNTTTSNTNPVGSFNLASAATVYAGFYTTGGRVAFTGIGGQTTDHASAVVAPRGGVTIGGFSNPNLAHTYAFDITADASTGLIAGPGFLANGGADGGPRLNVDNNRPVLAPAGAYDVTDFSFNGTTAGGSVVPFLARLTGANTYQAVWIGGSIAGQAGGVSVDPAGGFTLASDETLYAGFYTTDTATVAFTEGPGRPPGFGVTDHNGAFTPPTAAGDTIGGFSNADLARTYAFTVGFAAVPEPGSAALVGLVAAAGLLRRRR